jgi:hypothetical protein
MGHFSTISECAVSPQTCRSKRKGSLDFSVARRGPNPDPASALFDPRLHRIGVGEGEQGGDLEPL